MLTLHGKLSTSELFMRVGACRESHISACYLFHALHIYSYRNTSITTETIEVDEDKRLSGNFYASAYNNIILLTCNS